MAQQSSIENVQNLAVVGGQIVRWAGGRSVEAAFKTSGFALGIASRGLGKVLDRTVQLADRARIAVNDRSEIARTQSLEKYHEDIAGTQGILETSQNALTVKAVLENQGKTAFGFSQFCIQHDFALDLNTHRDVTERILHSDLPVEDKEYVLKNLRVDTPIGQIIESEHGLEAYVGSIDPSVPYATVGETTLPPLPTQQEL